jgi:hypothetical protein
MPTAAKAHAYIVMDSQQNSKMYDPLALSRDVKG